MANHRNCGLGLHDSWEHDVMTKPKQYTVQTEFAPISFGIMFEGTFIVLRNDLAVWFNVDRHFNGEEKAIADFYPLLAQVKRRTIARIEMEKARIATNNSRPEIEALIRAYN